MFTCLYVKINIFRHVVPIVTTNFDMTLFDAKQLQPTIEVTFRNKASLLLTKNFLTCLTRVATKGLLAILVYRLVIYHVDSAKPQSVVSQPIYHVDSANHSPSSRTNNGESVLGFSLLRQALLGLLSSTRARRRFAPSVSRRCGAGKTGAGAARFGTMVTPLVKRELVKKRLKKFKRMQSDRKICVKVSYDNPLLSRAMKFTR
jgi:hypothetical protein